MPTTTIITQDTGVIGGGSGGSAGGAASPGASNDFYTVTAAKLLVTGLPAVQFNCTGIVVCNRGEKTRFTISYAPAGAAEAVGQYLCYNCRLRKGETKTLDFSMVMSPDDVVRVASDSGQVDYHLMGYGVTESTVNPNLEQ